MAGTVYGYVRVSTKEQNAARQLAAMGEFGVPEVNLVVEKLSGKDFHRPAYRRLVKRLQPGDVLVVKSIDRLGRNYAEILEQWADLTKKRGAAIVVLDMPLLNTHESRDLTGTLISDIVLQLLSYVAETERSNIRKRQAEGIAAARQRGIHLGRERMEMPQGFDLLARSWARGEVSSRSAAKQLGISHQTFLRRAKECCPEASPVYRGSSAR